MNLPSDKFVLYVVVDMALGIPREVALSRQEANALKKKLLAANPGDLMFAQSLKVRRAKGALFKT